MNALEQDVLEVQSLVQFLKNSFEPISRIPQDVLSLIPDYFGEDGRDQNLITLTHVCRRWRDVFTSRPSLWTRLDFMNFDKTRDYIQRSKSSPLEISIEDYEDPPFPNAAFSLVIPHLHRLKSLAISGEPTSDFFKHFHFHAPLLEELTVEVDNDCDLVLEAELFNGDLSSLRRLSLSGVTTHLPWRNLANLRAVTLGYSTHLFGLTRLLDFLESAPLLRTIELRFPIPSSSDDLPQRVVPLRHLNALHITADSPHSILLNHLSIPTGASLIQEFKYEGEIFPFRDHLPESPTILSNLSHITAINFHFDPKGKALRLTGPSGEFRMVAHPRDNRTATKFNTDRQILHSLDPRFLSMTRGLSFSQYNHSSTVKTGECPVFRTLSSTLTLQTLVLARCNGISFLRALDPTPNQSTPLLCPNLEELVLYIESSKDQFDIERLIDMAKNRASRGAKLSSITMVYTGALVPGTQALRLREYITHVEYRFDVLPAWDVLLSGLRQLGRQFIVHPGS